MSELEDLLFGTLKMAGVELPVREYKFHPTRKWRFDFAYPDRKIALEVEGGTWKGRYGRHTNPVGFAADATKYNEAAVMGWRVFRFTSTMISDGTALDMVERALASRIEIVNLDDLVGGELTFNQAVRLIMDRQKQEKIRTPRRS